MIRIHKPATPPAVLTTRGASETARLCAEYDAHRAEYRSGALPTDFIADIYGAPEVRAALLAAQHGKCAFCESKIEAVMYGDVEHYRPKRGFARRRVLMRPGYYWLAYDWDNLLVACQLCNQRHKRNAFPLIGGSRRARSHHADVAKERPHFVHPTKEDPTAVIGFHDHVAYAVGDDVRGRWTIRGLGLNRPKLKEERERHLQFIKVLASLVRVQPPSPDRAAAEALLAEAVADDAEYAAMARVLLAAVP